MKKDKHKHTAQPASAAGPAAEKAPESPPSAAAEPEEALQDRLLRLMADFENFRKRTLKERGEWSLRANQDLLTELLPVLDHFDLGLQTAGRHQTDPAVLDGFRLVYEQLLAALAKFGLSPVDAEGTAFDPHLHEAVSHMPSDEHPADSIIAQTRRGYRLGDQLLRPAQVVVSSGPAGPAAPGGEEGFDG